MVELHEYLAMDDASQRGHEYVAGVVFAMTGSTERHNRIAFNVARILDERLEGMPLDWLGGEPIAIGRLYAGTELG